MISVCPMKKDHAVQRHPLLLPFAKLLTDAQALLKMLQGGSIVAQLSMNMADFVQCRPFLLLIAKLLADAQALLKMLHSSDIVLLRLKNIADAQDRVIESKRIGVMSITSHVTPSMEKHKRFCYQQA